MNNIGITFIIIISTFTLICVLGASASAIARDGGRQCSRDRSCNYGGKCDRRGNCRCMFDCDTASWPADYYCGPKTNGGRKYHRNLCVLLAHACELQEDIPLVKFNMDRMACEDEISPIERLCDHPKDHMGSCGGSLSLEGSIGAGICLIIVENNGKRCQCPNNKEGDTCHQRVTRADPVGVQHSESERPSSGYKQTKIAMFAAVSLVVVVAVVGLIINSFRSNRRSTENDSSKQAILTPSSERDDLVIVAVEEEKKPPMTASSSSSKNSIQSNRRSDFPNRPIRERLSGKSIDVVPALTCSSLQSNCDVTGKVGAEETLIESARLNEDNNNNANGNKVDSMPDCGTGNVQS